VSFTHIALVGLMGSGKSAVGAVLSERLGLPLVDVDEQVHVRTGMSVRDLWERGGEEAYRPLEREIVLEALAPGAGRVLAAPGGVAVDPIAAAALAQPHVAVVYLRAEPGVLAERIRNDPQPRPLLEVHPEAQLAQMHRERDLWYRGVADRVEEVAGAEPLALAVRMLDAFGCGT
jgi:shikimate kinase